jgi:hypothetical protein
MREPIDWVCFAECMGVILFLVAAWYVIGKLIW